MKKVLCVLLLVCVVAGCGPRGGPKLSEMSYAELTVLLEVEARKLDEAFEQKEKYGGEFVESYNRQVDHTKMVRDLRRAAWERETKLLAPRN